MKKYFLGLLATVLLLNVGYSQIKVEDYFNRGDLHNKALDYVLSNLDESKFSKNVDENVDYVNRLLIEFYAENNLDISNSEKYKYFMVKDNFYNYLNEGAYAYKDLSNKVFKSISSLNESAGLKDNEPTYSTLLSNSLRNQLIDEYELSTLNKIKELIDNNIDGLNTASEILKELNSYKDEFNSKKYAKNENAGHVLAITLAISIKSMEWWVKNENSVTYILPEPNFILASNGPNGDVILKENSLLIAPWVGLDIAGAVISGGIAASGQYVLTGSVDWGMVGWAAVGGAVSGSTGAVGRLAKLITR